MSSRRHCCHRQLALGAALLGCSLAAISETHAAIGTIDPTSCGSDDREMSGANAGLTFGQPRHPMLSVVPGGRLVVSFYSGGIGLMALNGNSPQGVFEFATNNAIASPTSFAAGSLIDGPNAANWTDSSSQTFWRTGPPYASPSFGAGSFLGFRFSTNNGTDWDYGYIEVLWNNTGTASNISFELLPRRPNRR